MNKIDLNSYFKNIGHSEYQRENFDAFLKKVSFDYHIPSIHIAGTNGKGSTANFLANIYQQSGLKVGLFVSPYLHQVNDMISVDKQLISDEQMIDLIQGNDRLFKKYCLSPFEIQTYIALSYFISQQCDIAIIECGMGGEIDATNIFQPLLSVITSISLEHTAFLGRSISEIAYHKAGIIKENIPVVTGILEEDALNTIVEVAKERKSQVICAVEPSHVVYENRGYNFSYANYRDLRINNAAYYALKDACIALEVIEKLKNIYFVSEQQIKEGLANTYLEVRMEMLSEEPLIIIDGSHNPEGVLQMSKSLNDVANSKHLHILFAAFKDKNIERMLAYLGEYSDDIVLTTFPNARAREEQDYFLFLDDFVFVENAIGAFNDLKNKYPNDCILITGSLAFAAYMKEMIK